MAYLPVNGTQLYHEVAGEGEPVLLLHGGFCSIETMRPQFDALSTRYRVHAMERPGHGRSADRTGAFSYADIVADILGYLDAVQVPSAHLLGFSDGAIAGLLLAIDHHDRVRSLIAIGANTDPSGLVEDSPEGDADTASSPRALLRRRIEDRMQFDYERLSPDGPGHADVIRGKLEQLWRTEPHIPAERLGDIHCPTLILAADRDAILTRHTVAIAEHIPDAQLCIVPGASHLVMMERPELVSRIALDFLESTRDAPASVPERSGVFGATT